MRVSPQRKIGEIIERREAACAIDLPARRVTPKHLGRFDIDEMRRVESLAGSEQTLLYQRGPARA